MSNNMNGIPMKGEYDGHSMCHDLDECVCMREWLYDDIMPADQFFLLNFYWFSWLFPRLTSALCLSTAQHCTPMCISSTSVISFSLLASIEYVREIHFTSIASESTGFKPACVRSAVYTWLTLKCARRDHIVDINTAFWLRVFFQRFPLSAR